MRLFIKEFYKPRLYFLVNHPNLSDHWAIQNEITRYYVYPIFQRTARQWRDSPWRVDQRVTLTRVTSAGDTFGFRDSPWFFNINEIERIKNALALDLTVS